MSNELLRADILASWSRVSSFQEQGALLNRCYVALGEQQSAPAGYVLVPVELLTDLRDSANDCYNNEVRRYKDDRRRIIYKALVDKADELLATAPRR